jgi:tRNA(Glu) U13 pseudouridine synthase TruD
MNATNYSGDQFVPAEVKEYVGEEKVKARYKVEPEDFIVEEWHKADHICTINEENDLTDAQIAALNASGKPGLVGFTVVKKNCTTYDVQDDVGAHLEVPKYYVTFGGMKDGKAVTSNRHVGQNVHLDDVLELAGKRYVHGDGWWFIKDVALASEPLDNGMLVGNRFRVRVLVPGMKGPEIDAYVNRKLDGLRKLAVELGRDLGRDFGDDPQILIPNAFGGQRDGKRRNLKDVGETLWRKGPRAAVRRFLCENSGNEKQEARALRDELADQFGWLEFSEKSGQEADSRPYFWEMRKILERPMRNREGQVQESYKVLSMTVEYEIVKKLAVGISYEDVMASMFKNFSLWIGAYQAYWFNRVLARIIRKEIILRGSGSIPLLTCTPEAIRFYQRYCPEALPLKPDSNALASNRALGEWALEVDPTVKRMFLTPRKGRNGRENSPWRKALIPVMNLKHHSTDGVWHAEFTLRSGAYATVLFECLFDVEQSSEPRHEVRHRHGARGGRAARRC